MKKPKVYDNIWAMLSDPEVDVPWIMTPNFTRVETVEAIVEESLQGSNDFIGVTCEKPLARNVKEADRLIDLIGKTELLHGYLENQVYSPSIIKARDSVWRHGAKGSGRPYLARSSEEHGGPHSSWFWDPTRSGGGVLLDMTCHSIEAGRYLLQDPGKGKNSLRPLRVQGDISCLKWRHEPYVSRLKENFGVDYTLSPAEDYSSVKIVYEDDAGGLVLSETRTSWCYTGPGLRLSFEVLGPEYSVNMNSLNTDLSVFFSRNLSVPQSEEFIEKQEAEQGLIPIVSNEAISYGYQGECQHMVERFMMDENPSETWDDGYLVVQLMMTAYKSAEQARTLEFNEKSVKNFIPSVQKGTWKP
jgi:predicted dehydrogenase